MAARMTLSTRNNRAVLANLRQYGERAKERAKVVVQESADRVYNEALSLAPVDTGFMIEHLRQKFTPAGFGYQLGFEESDFTSAGKEFYPVHVIFGTRFMPARDFLFGPAIAERPRFRAELKHALRTQG